MNVEDFRALIADTVPLSRILGLIVEEIGPTGARLRMPASDDVLRPGGTVSGPALMALADFALYGAVLGRVGAKPMAVTTNLNFNFLRRPPPGDILAEARLLRLGRRLAVGEVFMRHHDGEDPVAHATGTYSLPPG
jgi:uncharacterized protein (TIGR00369 family)